MLPIKDEEVLDLIDKHHTTSSAEGATASTKVVYLFFPRVDHPGSPNEGVGAPASPQVPLWLDLSVCPE